MFLYPADHYFLDTEFYDPTRDIHPRNAPFVNLHGNRMEFALDFFSVGLVSDTGREFYGAIRGIDEQSYRGHWVYDNVIRQLPPEKDRLSLDQIGLGLLDVFETPSNDEKIINIWGRNKSYDVVVLDRIFGGQLTFHTLLREQKGIMRVKYRDINDILALVGPGHRLPEQSGPHHIAIEDARGERDIFLGAYSILEHRGLAVPRALAPQPG